MAEEILPTLPGEPQRMSRGDVLYNTLVPEWLKQTINRPPPPGMPQTPGKMPEDRDPTMGAIPWGADIASNFVGGGEGSALKGAALLKGMIMGPMARGANLPKLAQAKAMLETGKFSPEAIHDLAGGWFQGHGGEWKFEVPDTKMLGKALPMGVKPDAKLEGHLGTFIHHPDFFNAYPGADKIPVMIDPSHGPAGNAFYSPKAIGGPHITIGGEVGRVLSPMQKSSILHESGHFVQDVEPEFNQNAAPPDWSLNKVIEALVNSPKSEKGKKLASEALDTINWSDKNDLAYQMYWNMPAEVEPRNIENRFWLSQGKSPYHRPKFTDYDTVSSIAKKHGFSLDASSSGGLSNYKLRKWGSDPKVLSNYVNPSEVPRELREVYDRLPINEYTGKMAGNPKYPWKTEDVPRWEQFDYIKKAMDLLGQYWTK